MVRRFTFAGFFFSCSLDREGSSEKQMDLPSSVALLLRGFDRWVVEAKPSCEDATRVLRCLQRAAAQTKRVSGQTVPSIPVLLQSERFGRPDTRSFAMSSLPTDALLF